VKITIRYRFSPDDSFSPYMATCFIKWFPLVELYGLSNVSFHEARERLIEKVKAYTGRNETPPQPEKIEL